MCPAGSSISSEYMQPNPTPPSMLGNFVVDKPRPMKVVIIGAGYSGIIAGLRFRQRVQNIDLVIYENHPGIGGTWFVNKYPGLSCDIPSHSYQMSFAPNTKWSSFYSPGPEIHEYLESVVDKYQLRPLIKLQHRLTKAQYDENTGKWNLTLKRAPETLTKEERYTPGPLKKLTYDNWETIRDTADVLFMAIGCLNRWSWPDIKGLETFGGEVIHSAQWDTAAKEGDKTWQDTVSRWGDKKVGVIGVGSSAIQIVPAIQPKVKHLVNYVRGKTWISTIFVRDLVLKFSGGKDVGNYFFTEEDKRSFEDPQRYMEMRQEIERASQFAHHATVNDDPVAAAARAEFEAQMRKKLSKRPWIADHLVPNFGVGCRRVTPGPGYLEALCEENVDFVPTGIKEVKRSGIETVDGKFQELDIIICATGYDASYRPDFAVIGRGGVDLAAHYTPNPRTYLSVAVDGFPNMFQALGPNSAHGAGNLVIIIEAQVDYAVKATLKIQRERIKSMEAKREAVDDFERHIDSYFPLTTFGTKCRSWYKAGKEEGRVVAIWPGSPLHVIKALEHPRWEDYDYEYIDGKGRLYWFGNGNTMADVDPEVDTAWYLDPSLVDYPPIPN